MRTFYFCAFSPCPCVLRPLCSHHEPVVDCAFADPEPRTGRGLRRQDALDGRLQLGSVHVLAPHIQLRLVFLHEQRDVLPVARRQVHIFYGNHLLLVLGGEHDVQRVRFAVGDDLKHGSGAILLLHGEKASPCQFELLEIKQQEESPFGADGVDQVTEGIIGDRRDQVRVKDLVGRAVGIIAFDQRDPVVFPGDLDELEQVINTIVVSALCRLKGAEE